MDWYVTYRLSVSGVGLMSKSWSLQNIRYELRADVISRKFLIKCYEYSFDYLIIIMNQLRSMCYLVYSTVCSLPDTDLRNLLNSQTPTPPQDNSDRSLITPVGTCQNHICTALCRYHYYDTTGLRYGLQVFKPVV